MTQDKSPQGSNGAKKPNFLIILSDDMGYSDIGCFGSEIPTPNIDKLADEGIKFSDYHTSALCAPTRSMIMTGTDCHIAGCGVMREFKGWDPERWDKAGHEGYLNFDVATLPEVLQKGGYHTMMAGKWHLGLKKGYLPCDRGFDKSWSLLVGASNHFGWEPYVSDEAKKAGEKVNTGGPRLYADEDKRWMPEPNTSNSPEGFYSTTYYTDKLISYLQERTDEESHKPFFAYLPFSATHFPLHCLPGDRAKYKGKYDDGPDALRAKRLEKMKRLGIIAEDCEPHPVTIKSKHGWTGNEFDEMTDWERSMTCASYEVYAAMIDRMDVEVGKICDYLKKTGEYDNTVVMFFSDNGAAGAALEANRSMGTPITQSIDKYYDNSLENLGNHNSYVWLGPRWAQASTAPNRLYKSYSTEGGIRVPMVVRYPPFLNQDRPAGSICRALTTCMDLMPTMLDLAGLKHPHPGTGGPKEKVSYEGRMIYPMRGKSWMPYLNGQSNGIRTEMEAIHSTNDKPIGWEMHGRASLRHGPWKIVNIPAVEEYGTGEWQLYDLTKDQGEVHDLAKQYPEKLAEMIQYFKEYQEETGAVFGPAIRYETGMKSQAGTLAGDPTEDTKLWMRLGVGQSINAAA